MNKPIIYLSFIVFLISNYSCNNCQCVENKKLTGFYECTRSKTADKEYLWLLADSMYLHLICYNSFVYINCSKWHSGLSTAGSNIVELSDWIRTEKDGFVSYESMPHINKINCRKHLLSSYEYDFGCYVGLDGDCSFRLIEINEPMLNYKLITGTYSQRDFQNKNIEFYTLNDSLNYHVVHSAYTQLFEVFHKAQ